MNTVLTACLFWHFLSFVKNKICINLKSNEMKIICWVENFSQSLVSIELESWNREDWRDFNSSKIIQAMVLIVFFLTALAVFIIQWLLWHRKFYKFAEKIETVKISEVIENASLFISNDEAGLWKNEENQWKDKSIR